MTPAEPDLEPGLGTGPDPDPAPRRDDRSPASAVPRPARARTDPAAMRETLDAARRRLGPADRHTAPQSAELLRAMLREAAAESAPLPAHPDDTTEHRSTGRDDTGRSGR